MSARPHAKVTPVRHNGFPAADWIASARGQYRAFADQEVIRVRTIVFSDVHGEPAVIRRVVEHSDYQPGVDRLIFAGDAIEVGRDSWGCLELLDELGAEFVVGNHEYSVWDGTPIENECLDLHVHAAVSRHIDEGLWLLAASAEGVLITHAGVSHAFASNLGWGIDGDVEGLVAALNVGFAAAVQLGPGRSTSDVIGQEGPLWYRPSGHPRPLSETVQVAGHTPPEILTGADPAGEWAALGLHLIDPFVRRWGQGRGYGPPIPLRYAVIEDGTVSVVEDGI